MPSDLFSGWKSSGARVTRQAMQRRSLAVRATKRVLLGFAAVTVLSLIWMANFNKTHERFNLTFASVEEKEGMPPVMVKPKLQGIDAQGRPYTVAADSAMQQDAKNVELRRLQAEVTMADNSWITVMSDEGSLNTEAKMLFIRGNVQLFHDRGYEFRTESALVDMEHAMVQGERPIEGHGLLGTLKAGAFQIWSAQDHIRFDQRVKVILYPGSGDA